ncbi:hypothetical protein JIG36_08085 [Actinoplanes sp. LDG1-06]|uniref:Uncharacterized protein n=1 Tax=Paractinoplanes ovalisporus TaxID=2810368 RepID=A0ABS2A6Q3_9ACTN|nr:hypothetical protein [Actinoplanes ovalisporus]MBM2615523.1 hypothetical protein [Actinoplanes ovalisporus]
MRKVLVILSLALVSGCAVNQGTALAAEFDEVWAGTPDVSEVRTSGDNPLPFSGSAVGELVVADGTGADRVTQLAGELRRYVADNDHVTGRITAGGITVTVVAEEERNTESLGLWLSLTTDDRVSEGDLAETTSGRRIMVTAAGPEAVLDVFRDMVADGGRHEPLTRVRSLTVMTGPRATPYLSLQTDHEGRVPEPALAAYEAVRAEYEVVRASVRADRTAGSLVSIVVSPDADLAAATELARSAAPGLGAALKVTGS